MKIRRLNEDAKRFYVDEIVSAQGGKTETERHSFSTVDELKQYCKDAGLTKDDIADCGGCDVKDLCEDIEKLHTKPNGEYLVKADSGKGYTAFSRDNVAIGGIDNEDADSDDKAIDKFKRNEYSECLNEAYFDTAEYRIQKYEDDIPELMAGMHDDYMEGKLDAARYAEVLKKVYDALAECDYKHTMSAPVVTNGSGKRVLDRLAELDKTNEALGIGAGLALGGAAIGAGMVGSALLDSVEDENKGDETELNELFDIEIDAKGFGGSGNNVHVGPGSMPLTASLEENEDDKPLNEESNKYYAAKYTAVDNSGNKTQKKICFMCDGTIEDAEKLADELIKEPYSELNVIGSVLKGSAEKDGFVFVESVASNDYGTPEEWEELESAETMDDAREWCNLTLWKNTSTGKYVIIIGDNNPWEGYSNIETFSEDEARSEFSAYLDDPMYNSDDYDDDYSDDYDESLEECSGIKAHKVIMGEDTDDSIEFDDFDGVEGPEGDKTEDIEFVMDEYVSESLLIDFIEKVDPITYKVGANDQVVTVVFDPKWSEYVYTIDGKGPYSHRSYEFISRDIYDFVMSQIDASELDDLDD